MNRPRRARSSRSDWVRLVLRRARLSKGFWDVTVLALVGCWRSGTKVAGGMCIEEPRRERVVDCRMVLGVKIRA